MFDEHDATIAEHFLPAIVNGDYTGLSDDDAETLDEWLADWPNAIIAPKDIDAEPYIGVDDISGLSAEVIDVTIHTLKGD